MWILLKGHGPVSPHNGGWSPRPGGSRTPADVRPHVTGCPSTPGIGLPGSGEVACPPHVTPDRHRADEPDGRRVLDLARRRRAPAQGHRRRRAGAGGREGGRRAPGRRRRRPRGHRDPVADRGQARPLAGEDRGADRGEGHPEARARRLGHPRSRVGQAAGRRRRRAPGAARRRPARRGARGTRPVATPGARRPRPRGGSGPRRPGGRRPGDGEGRPARGERPVAPTSTVHRNAMLATLRPEQIPVAEQLLRGGLHAVRQAIETQNTAAKAGGKPPVAGDALLAMADELLPAVRLADWKDRASVAQTAGKDYRLRELRAVVAASRTVNLDEEGAGHGQGAPGVARPAHDGPARGVAGPHHERPQRRPGPPGGRGVHPAPRARDPLPGRAGRPAWPARPGRP